MLFVVKTHQPGAGVWSNPRVFGDLPGLGSRCGGFLMVLFISFLTSVYISHQKTSSTRRNANVPNEMASRRERAVKRGP